MAVTRTDKSGTVRLCPICAAPMPPHRQFCRLSCRLENDRRRLRRYEPSLFRDDLETELPPDPLAGARAALDAVDRRASVSQKGGPMTVQWSEHRKNGIEQKRTT